MGRLLSDLKGIEIWGMMGATVSFSVAALSGAVAIFTVLNMVFGVMDGTINHDNLVPYFIGLALLFLLQAGSITLGDRLNHMAGFSLVKRLRESIILKLQQLSLAFYTKEQLSEVSTVVHKDVDTMEMVIAHLWSRMFASIIVSIIIGTYLFISHWKVALAMVCILPIAFLALFLGTRKKQRAHKENLEDNVNMLGYFLEFTKGMSILKSYAKNDSLQKRLNRSVEKFGTSSTHLANSIAFTTAHYFSWLEISYLLVITLGIYVLSGDTFTLIDYTIFVIMSKEFLKPFFAVESYYVSYIMVKSSYDRVHRIINEPVLEDIGNRSFPQKCDIVFENVSFTYEKEDEEEFRLNSLNFKIAEGTMTALVGPSGSGKTTLTNLLLRFYDPDLGVIKIDGVDIRNISYDTLLTNIAVVMQDVFLFSGSIKENLLMGNQCATEKEIVNAAKQAMIHDEIMEMPDGYDTVIGERGLGLSGGQRQRISIARAFIKGAKIIILDEATSNVDPINEHSIQRAISNLAKDRTVIVIAHHLRTIKNADQIVVLEDGIEVEKGVHRDLLSNNKLYTSLWNAQNR